MNCNFECLVRAALKEIVTVADVSLESYGIFYLLTSYFFLLIAANSIPLSVLAFVIDNW